MKISVRLNEDLSNTDTQVVWDKHILELSPMDIVQIHWMVLKNHRKISPQAKIKLFMINSKHRTLKYSKSCGLVSQVLFVAYGNYLFSHCLCNNPASRD